MYLTEIKDSNPLKEYERSFYVVVNLGNPEVSWPLFVASWPFPTQVNLVTENEFELDCDAFCASKFIKSLAVAVKSRCEELKLPGEFKVMEATLKCQLKEVK